MAAKFNFRNKTVCGHFLQVLNSKFDSDPKKIQAIKRLTRLMLRSVDFHETNTKGKRSIKTSTNQNYMKGMKTFYPNNPSF